MNQQTTVVSYRTRSIGTGDQWVKKSTILRATVPVSDASQGGEVLAAAVANAVNAESPGKLEPFAVIELLHGPSSGKFYRVFPIPHFAAEEVPC